MGRLFKLGSDPTGAARKRGTRSDWHCKIRIGPYDFKRARLCTDAGASESWAAMLQAAMDRKGAGEPPDPDAMKKLPRRLLESFGLVSELAGKRRGSYSENVEDYIRELETANRDRMYIRNVKRCLTNVGTACGWKRLADVNREALTAHLTQRKADGAAPRTMNNVISTVRAFGSWCVEAKRLDANPCDRVKRVDATADRRRIRRALTRAECSRLLAVAGPRELLYRFALGTGLRRRELKLLQWRDVDLTDPVLPCLRLRVEATKSKRADVLPLAPAIAARLRAKRGENAAPTEPVFRLGRTRTLIPKFATWLNDLERAGIVYRAADRSILGIHSLRVTYVTELQRAGLPPRTVMQLARHTDFRLTAGTYTDMRLIDTFGAVQCLPTYDTEPTRQVALRTGTDDLPIGPESTDQIQDQKSRANPQRDALSCSETDFSDNRCQNHGTRQTSTLRKKNRHFPHIDDTRENASDLGKTTGLLGLEPRTF